jgi:hypothetical protein
VSGIGGGNVEVTVLQNVGIGGERNADRETNCVKNVNVWPLSLLRHNIKLESKHFDGSFVCIQFINN